MREYSSLLEQLEAWTSELLLRGVAQIGLKDVERLQELRAGAKRCCCFNTAVWLSTCRPVCRNGSEIRSPSRWPVGTRNGVAEIIG
ncbi:MAG: hypothetical protein ACQEXX_14735 [Bacillota bacterium]